MIEHPIPPTYDQNSQILILGSFPSVKSREYGYFYGHPQNRFWKVISAVFNDSFPETKEDKKRFLLKHNIAAWDVIASCEIKGSSDSSITNVKANDLGEILKNSKVRKIFVNGKKAAQLYKKYIEPVSKIPAITLPSTSPANAAWKLERLIDEWKVLKI
ncbi:MAG: DNA-deoxyinosine glycosylase [Fusobacterium sp.]|uniref:DNA-deoxyinosine glycosylase n=1 Tax=Fusobacterium sp. TaxID=68766 RepID=UPI0026DAC9CA|nr:DNA-deoxyinosine glycosylase [Fusobacterium sp.]MDO4689928.1 DNA-deoxyinosine glycosylase [Fusobacterium sp.]